MTKRIEKIAGAVLFALILIVAVDLGVDALDRAITPAPVQVAEAPPAQEAAPTQQAAAAPEGPAPAEPQAAAPPPAEAAPVEASGGIEAVAPDPITPLVAAASVEAGEAGVKICKACHTFDDGGPNRVGPNLHGVVGRDIASVEGFAYSDILKTLPGAWDDEKLDAYLLNPRAAAPGNKMAFAGVKKAEDRAAVIAYLRSISPNAPPLE